MENALNVVHGGAPAMRPFNSSSALPEECFLARAVRFNLHIVHGNRIVQDILELFLFGRHELVAGWRPGQRRRSPSGRATQHADPARRRRAGVRRSAAADRLAGASRRPDAGGEHDTVVALSTRRGRDVRRYALLPPDHDQRGFLPRSFSAADRRRVEPCSQRSTINRGSSFCEPTQMS